MSPPTSRISGCGLANMSSKITAHVQDYLAGSTPLLYSDAELYTPSPQGEVHGHQGRTLLGRGVAVLLDPLEVHRVGVHEFLFFGDGNSEPLVRWPIGPRVRLEREAAIGIGGTQAVLVFVVQGEPGCALAFSTEEDAAAFARDFRVRQKLMALSLKASRSLGSVEALREQVSNAQQGLLSKLWALQRWIGLLILMGVLAVVVRVVILMLKWRVSADVASQLALHDVGVLVSATMNAAVEKGGEACLLLMKMIPSSSVEQCALNHDGEQVRQCALNLLRQVVHYSH
eukprot:gnl/TRDRNA2_/TRDRNA2_183090_c0_seq1.p1 gnl/TRDRNA2_/TRDRNA2_183090_c0~~gnl/TRDRNA2_/TRDRNA2_183090_c0_seq1.p1  ORF type:complete len:286 (-),score=46.65 gnl/TRDRNA2_/TRDRNA2_183090_c0_seq1:257-1114(-)